MLGDRGDRLPLHTAARDYVAVAITRRLCSRRRALGLRTRCRPKRAKQLYDLHAERQLHRLRWALRGGVRGLRCTA